MTTTSRVRGRRGASWVAAAAAIGVHVSVAAAALASPAPVPRGLAAGTGAMSVEAARGRLSVALRQAPLDAVLEAIGRETGVVVRSYGPLARAVSDRFRGLTLETALRRLLRPFNVVFVYAPRPGRHEGPRLQEVIIYPSQPAPAAPPAGPSGRAAEAARAGVPATDDEVPAAVAGQLARLEALGDPSSSGGAPAEVERAAGARELERYLADPDPAVRRRALEVAEETRLLTPDALRSAALQDGDVQVRWAALAALVATAGRPAAVAAAQDGLTSTSPAVRLAALEALGEQLGGEAGESAARRALSDPDPAVRAKATEIVSIIEEGRQLAPGDAEEGEDADEPDVSPGQSG